MIFFWLVLAHAVGVPTVPLALIAGLMVSMHDGGGGPYILEWDAPADCPTAADVREAIDRTLPDTVADASIIVARARVAAAASQWRLELELDDRGRAGTRVLEASSCLELANAAALIVAIAVDPDVLLHGSAPEVRELESEAEAIDSLVPAPDARQPSPRESVAETAREGPDETDAVASESSPPAEGSSKSRLSFGARALAGASVGILPNATASLELAFALSGTGWRAEIGAAYWTPTTADSRIADVGGRFQLGAAVLRGCGVPSVRRLGFPLCLALDLGGVHGRGVGELDARRAVAPWVALRPGAALRWAVLPRLALWVGGDVVVPLTQVRFHTDRTPELFRLGAVGGTAVVGIEVRQK